MLKGLSKIAMIYASAAVLLGVTAIAQSSKIEEKAKNAEAAKPAEKKGDNKMSEVYAVFDTSMGKFKAKLFADKAPETVKNFTDLAEGKSDKVDSKYKGKKFFDNTKFHRVIPSFMIQGGDPLGNGTGGPGYTFKDEFAPGLKHDKVGLLSMANRGPGPNGAGTNGSQFFVTVEKTPWLDGKHAIFGEVVEGYDIVEKISKSPKDSGDKPTTDIVVKSVTIERK
ncbi:MAG: peptidylprolyl isomerase [Bdellovibrionota bacterium]